MKTSSLSRGHDLFVDDSGLITITGGKWTTYRQMAEDAVNKAIEVGKLQKAECRTETLAIEPTEIEPHGERLTPDMPYTRADAVRAVRSEMARTVEDVLARRTRVLFLNVEAAARLAPEIAEIMAAELSKDTKWKDGQVREFLQAARSYKISARE